MHFPQTILLLARLYGVWPKNNYFTIIEGLVPFVCYAFNGFWAYLGNLASIVLSLSGLIKLDLSDNVLFLFETTFFIYIYLSFILNVDDFIELVNDLSNFDNFGAPRDLEMFKKQHNTYMKFICVYTFFDGLLYPFLIYLQAPSCVKKNIELNMQNPCGFVFPIWVPFDLEHYYVKNILLGVQMICFFCTTSAAMVGTWLTVTCMDLIPIRFRHLKEILEEASHQTDYQLKKNKFIWCIKYHTHIIQQTQNLDNCLQNTMAVHFCLSSIIIGTLNYQIWSEFQLKAVVHFIGWLLTMIILCHSGQNIIDESLSICDKLYDLNWYECDPEIKGYIKMMMLRSQRQLSVKSGILYSFSYERLLVILQASYTYMTILNRFVAKA